MLLFWYVQLNIGFCIPTLNFFPMIFIPTEYMRFFQCIGGGVLFLWSNKWSQMGFPWKSVLSSNSNLLAHVSVHCLMQLVPQWCDPVFEVLLSGRYRWCHKQDERWCKMSAEPSLISNHLTAVQSLMQPLKMSLNMDEQLLTVTATAKGFNFAPCC